MKAPILILASASARRLALLRQIGMTPDQIVSPGIDETPKPAEPPRLYALRMASEKANWAAEKVANISDAIILAADTVVACGRRILPKAEDADTVRRCLKLLSGRRHTVISAVCVRPRSGDTRLTAVTTRLSFRRLTDSEIEHYVSSGEGLGKAGGYAIQGKAAIFVKQLNGCYTNVVGLPLPETFLALRACGLSQT